MPPQITVFKYKRKKHYRRTQGHRQQLTRFLVQDIVQGAGPMPDPAEEATKARRGQRKQRALPTGAAAAAAAAGRTPGTGATAAQLGAAEPAAGDDGDAPAAGPVKDEGRVPDAPDGSS